MVVGLCLTPATGAPASDHDHAVRVVERLLPPSHAVFTQTFEEYTDNLKQSRPAVAVALDGEGRDGILSLARRHPDPRVRRLILEVTLERLPEDSPSLRRLVSDLIHDSDDLVAFRAIRASGELRLHESFSDLVRIAGRPSTTRTTHGKPVGIGAALVREAQVAIAGSRDPAELRAYEETMLGYGGLEGRGGRGPEIEATDDTGPCRDPRLDGMVEVEAGPFISGLARSRLPAQRFVASDYAGEATIYLGVFHISRHPVTNEQYDAFVRSVRREGHRCCHPDEKPDKHHTRNTLRDPRFGPDHPVTGVDYYDALAYCRWRGLSLPSELEWEKAARGADGHLYPWGDTWRPERVSFAESVFGMPIKSTAQWRFLLTASGERFPEVTTRSINGQTGDESPYGVDDLLGNVWEWTRTNYYTRDEMVLGFRGLEIDAFTNHPAAFPVIRGGAWSSIPEMLTTAYRGKDLLTDRHNEIGFRCAYTP